MEPFLLYFLGLDRPESRVEQAMMELIVAEAAELGSEAELESLRKAKDALFAQQESKCADESLVQRP